MKDWKTTIPGLVAAIATALAPVIPPRYAPICVAVNAAALAILGVFSKQTGNPS